MKVLARSEAAVQSPFVTMNTLNSPQRGGAVEAAAAGNGRKWRGMTDKRMRGKERGEREPGWVRRPGSPVGKGKGK